MKIRIIQIGKNKDKYIDEAVSEFLKRLRGFADVEIVTLKELGVSKTFTKEQAVGEEGKEILEKIDSRFSRRAGLARGNDDKCGFIVALDENGKEYSSVGFSGFLKGLKDGGGSVTFVIGGPYGLAETVKKRANLVFSLSKMTFTHQMIRVFLLEQIYRGFCIMAGKEYHNE